MQYVQLSEKTITNRDSKIYQRYAVMTDSSPLCFLLPPLASLTISNSLENNPRNRNVPPPVKREGLPDCISPSPLYGGKGQGLGGYEFANSNRNKLNPHNYIAIFNPNLQICSRQISIDLQWRK